MHEGTENFLSYKYDLGFIYKYNAGANLSIIVRMRTLENVRPHFTNEHLLLLDV